MNNFEGFDYENSEVLNRKIVDLARILQLEAEPDDIQELVDYVEGELSTEDLLELEEQRKIEEIENERKI